MEPTIEHGRLSDDQRERWARWGAYLSDRAWGTVRESTPDAEDSWPVFPWEQAGARVYRWSEDGIGGFCDERQRICLALAFWNERDPILKERFFGLSNGEGNHGEDVKDYFFYQDSLPSGAYLRMRYVYPQAEFPYARLRQENALRGQDQPEFELIDALPRTFGEHRYFDIVIEYAKADAEDILCRVTATNRGPDAAPLHILPLIWFSSPDGEGGPDPGLAEEPGGVWASVVASHPELGARRWSVEGSGDLLFTNHASDLDALYDQPNQAGTVNAIDRAVVRGRRDALNPAPRGTRCAAHRRATLQPGESWSVRIRFRPAAAGAPAAATAEFDRLMAERAAEADAFYAAVQRSEHTDEARAIQRAAFAGLNWNKVVYRFAVERWLQSAAGHHLGDAAAARERSEKHAEWRHLDACDVISVPDPWEFPFLATWDLDFQLITLCLIDPLFARKQALLLLSERYQRPDGALPGAEGDFSRPHPPLHAWAVWHIYQLGGRDRDFLAAAYPGLKRHFAWWRRTQRHPDGLFGGGFLGMDNISLFDRNTVPAGYRLAQADGTGWMAHFALAMLALAIELGRDEEAAEFLDEFAAIRRALAGLWDAESGFFYDALVDARGRRIPLKVRSLAGLVPLVASMLIDPAALTGLPRLSARLEALGRAEAGWQPGANGCILLAAAREQLVPLLNAMFDPDEFSSPYGIRSVSQRHEATPVAQTIAGQRYDLRYAPGEPEDAIFGGNSNWRGPIWAPLNHALIETLHQLYGYFGANFRIAGVPGSLDVGARLLVDRLIALFRRDPAGRRPFFGNQDYFQTDPDWRDSFWFYEYFHAESGAGLGASHQNGWTALIAKLLHDEGRSVFIPRSPAAASHPPLI